MKRILITGSNKGIGFETARQIAQMGHVPVISGRSRERVEEALNALRGDDFTVESMIMDVADSQSILDAARGAKDSGLKLHALINNAGILLPTDNELSMDKESVFDRTFKTNVYGPLRIIRAFLPLMSSPGRIINVSSGGGSMTDDVGGWAPAYCASKTALNGLTRQLAYSLAGRNISVNAVCPGWVQTDMGGASAPRMVQQGAATQVWLALEAPPHLTGLFFRDRKVIPW